MLAFLRCAAMLCAICFSAADLRAQSVASQEPERGSTELQVWSGAGHSVKGGTNRTVLWTGGLRYGWVLTDAHGPSVLRGQFEYAIDWVPLNLIFQPQGVVYGAGVNPFALKWLFVTRHGVTPYIDLGGGVLFTTHDVPAGISNINFASGSGVGVNVGRGKAHWSLEVRWQHISDAGLTDQNPGINTVQLRVGLGWFQHRE
jgi:lipid A 3-O-deacylase PagL